MPKEDARARYIGLATRRFARSGFHGTSLDMLAQDAGVSKQALLHFFKSKEKLYFAVLADLSDRLLAFIDGLDAPSPEARLIACFDPRGRLVQSDDARLVVRALLDSDAAARTWPLKPFLDRLVLLAAETRRWRNAPDAQILAGLYHLIGAAQYFAISEPTLAGMYGKDGKSALASEFADALARAARAFVAVD